MTQEVFNKVHKGLPGYKGQSSLSAWIYRIATNTAIDRARTHAFKHDKTKDSLEKNKDPKNHDVWADKKEDLSDHKVIKEDMSDFVKIVTL